MREQVYAWYPPASDVYKSYGESELDSYTKECLYRYGRSRYHDPRRRCCSVREEMSGRDKPPAKGPEEVALTASKISFLPQPPAGPSPLSVRSKSAVEGKPGMVSPEPGLRRLQRAGSSFQTTRGRTSSAWVKSRDWLAETNTSCGVAIKELAPEITAHGSVLTQQAPQSGPIPVPPANGHATRAQSAVIRRQESQVVKRPVQSAGPERQRATLMDPAAAILGAMEKEDQVRRRSRPWGPTPLRWGEEEQLGEGKGDAAAEGSVMEFPLDYDEQLKIHGWKMELPGDPLRIKRGCLAKRLSTNIVIPMEEVARKAGRNHVQSSETFFYNTIPRMPMSFTIHPDWASELLQTKQMELKTKAGIDGRRRHATCRVADFSFVY